MKRSHALLARAAVLALALPLATQHGTASAQGVAKERLLPQPVEPGTVAPWRAAPGAAGDPAETGSLYAAPSGPTLADWYAAQGRPALVLFFDRRLERLPPGWDGSARVMIAHETSSGGKTETENLTIGLEHKRATRSVRDRTPVVQLVENALTRELQRMRIKLIDPTFVERALSSKAKGGDTEFDSLAGAVGHVLEVELAATGQAVSMMGALKSLKSGEIVAAVNQPVEHDLHDPAGADALARSFIKRLLAVPTGER